MTILVRQAIIKDINSPHYNTVKDIVIADGIITEIGVDLPCHADQVIEHSGIHISPGWVDIFVTGTDPGFEFRDTLETTASSAARGGFTHIFLTPNTLPVVQNKSSVDYIRSKRLESPVQLHPIGAVTKNIEGKELTEMYEMKLSGAIAFSDGAKAIQSSGLLIKALQYVTAFDGTIIQIPDDRSIAPHGLMHEGVVSTQIGLPGKPALTEEIMVARDIALAKYTGSRLHITGISLATSVEMLRKAKADGVPVTCSSTPYHLLFTDQDLLKEYHTNFKVNPPLRTDKDKEALISAIKDGTIDFITTHHTPQHKDAKVCEFEYAGYGTLGLESAYGVLNFLLSDSDLILKKICFSARETFKINTRIDVGIAADITLYLPETDLWKHDSGYHSLSMNNVFEKSNLKGKVIGTIYNNKMNLNF